MREERGNTVELRKIRVLSHHLIGLITGVGKTKDPRLRTLFLKILWQNHKGRGTKAARRIWGLSVLI